MQKKCILVLAQTQKLVQGDGRSLNELATYGIFGATRGWSEGVFAASLQGAASSGLPPPLITLPHLYKSHLKLVNLVTNIVYGRLNAGRNLGKRIAHGINLLCTRSHLLHTVPHANS